ncbi:hypothetical protein ACQPZX_25095 [Actinoplanes sp. CA-142083]|uniref:hypothetical protein n=1 Tax=Actinoplanes sp. CA-142083 TaxID=3239903 RepID=UPI003D8F484B
MSDAFLGLLALCGLGLLTMAVLGFDQRAYARVLDGLFGAGFLGGTGYLAITVFDLKRPYWLVFLALVPLVALVFRERRGRRRRLAAGLIPQMYVAPPAATPLTPFPAPPPPLGAAPETEPEPPQRTTYQPLPSGLPRAAPAPPSWEGVDRDRPEWGTNPGRPAGHDTSAAQETSSRLRRPAYLESYPRPAAGGRHRASDPEEEEPPEERRPYRP